jgi:cytochrome c
MNIRLFATLATGIMPGGASKNPQEPDRGKVVKISKENGTVEFLAHGLRTPNGIGIGIDNEIFVADNQGDWLPSSKIVHVKKGSWYGSRSVDFEGTSDLIEKKPVVWLPQDEIGNSPS